MSVARTVPVPSGENDTGAFDRFTDFARQVMRVPHSQIKAQLDAEKAAKRPTASRASGVPSKKS